MKITTKLIADFINTRPYKTMRVCKFAVKACLTILKLNYNVDFKSIKTPKPQAEE